MYVLVVEVVVVVEEKNLHTRQSFESELGKHNCNRQSIGLLP